MTDHYERLIVCLVVFAAVWLDSGERQIKKPYVRHLRERPLLKQLFGVGGRVSYELIAFCCDALLGYTLLAYIDALRSSLVGTLDNIGVLPGGGGGVTGTLFFYVIACKYTTTRLFRLAASVRTTSLTLALACTLCHAVLLPLIGILIVSPAHSFLSRLALLVVFAWFALHMLWGLMLCSDLRNNGPPQQQQEQEPLPVTHTLSPLDLAEKEEISGPQLL